MNHSYNTLLSDSSENVYPDDTIATFQVQLAKSMDLESENWEVGVCGSTYPVSPPQRKVSWSISDTFIYCDLIESRLLGRCLTRSSESYSALRQLYSS